MTDAIKEFNKLKQDELVEDYRIKFKELEVVTTPLLPYFGRAILCVEFHQRAK